jgi:hypothetical protein
MATQNNKRKASDLGNDTGTGQNVMSLEAFMKRSDERSEQFESLLKQLVESNKNLTKKVEALGGILDDQQEIITGSSGTKEEEDDEEDSSDDEESVVDESDVRTVMLKQLRKYRIMNGNCNVLWKDKDNPKLGTWINNQRKHYKGLQTGKGRKIKPERIIKIERLGFSWNAKQAAPALWDEKFEQLQHFQQRMGNCNIPFNATDPTQLAKWVAFQRTEYKRWKKGRDTLLTLDQIKSLNDIGLDWTGLEKSALVRQIMSFKFKTKRLENILVYHDLSTFSCRVIEGICLGITIKCLWK